MIDTYNLTLFKPTLADNADITSLNQNWDTINGEIVEIKKTNNTEFTSIKSKNEIYSQNILDIKSSKFDDVVEGIDTLIFRANGVDKKVVRVGGVRGNGGITSEAIDNLQRQINELYKNGAKLKNLMTSVMELGHLSSNSGNPSDETLCIRTRDYVSVLPNTTYYMENNLKYSMYPNAYRQDKTFIRQIGKYDSPCVFTTPSDCYYIKFRTSSGSGGQNDLSAKFYLYVGSTNPNSLLIGVQDIIEYDGGYFGGYHQLEGEDTGIFQIGRHDGTQEFNIAEIAAPRDNPCEATLALTLRGKNANYFTDVSNMYYPDMSRGITEINCQSRGGYPLPSFAVKFNAGKGKKTALVIEPDATLVHFTNKGISVGGSMLPTRESIESLEEEFNRTYSSGDGSSININSSKACAISTGKIKGSSKMSNKINTEQTHFTSANRRKSFSDIVLLPNVKYTYIARCVGADSFPKSMLFYTPSGVETTSGFDFTSVGLKKHTFEVREQVTINTIFGSYAQYPLETNFLDFKEIMLLEGDYSNITDEEAEILLAPSNSTLDSTNIIVKINGMSYKVYEDSGRSQVLILRDNEEFYDELVYLRDGTVEVSTTNKKTQQITTRIIPKSQVEIPQIVKGNNTVSVGEAPPSKMFSFTLEGEKDKKIQALEDEVKNLWIELNKLLTMRINTTH